MSKQQNFLNDFIFEKKYTLARHILFWLITLLFLAGLGLPEQPSLHQLFQTALIYLPFNILYAYVIIYYFVPAFLIKEKYITFILAYGFWIIAGLCINALIRYYILFPLRYSPQELPKIRADDSNLFVLGGFMVMNTLAMFAFPVKVFKYWAIKQKAAAELEKGKIDAELQLLKAQLHPHFLFNTLNNLYSLVHEKSDKAAPMLLRLSGLLSYVLYECKATEVPLEKEIGVIKDYVALERERYDERLEISMNFSGDIENRMIAPMLFQPFIENAFKHGIAEQLGKVWMSIDLSVKNDQLLFKVINNCGQQHNTEIGGGIGISNVRKRLEILYPVKFEMKNYTEENVYIVSLTIELSPVKVVSNPFSQIKIQSKVV